MKRFVAKLSLVAGALWCASTTAVADEANPFRQPEFYAADANVHQVAYETDIISDGALPTGYESLSCESCDGGSCGFGNDCTSCGAGAFCDGGCADGACYPCDCYCADPYACAPAKGMCYAEAQLMFLRAHVSSDVVGKLSEKHELSPRFIVGYESPSGLGVRGRYWNYQHTTPNLDVPDDALDLDFEVIDIEGTHRFRSGRTDLVVAGGFRWATLATSVDGDSIGSEMPGITLAADIRSVLCHAQAGEWSGVCGVRWSLLGGDWQGDNNIIDETRDDNVSVQEIYGGVEYLHHRPGCDLYARMIFEVQNWHSDALGENSATDSIGFVGPGIQVGASY